MITVFIVAIVLSLFIVVCFRHFFIQLVGLKLFLDCVVILLISTRTSDTSSLNAQAAAILVSALSILVFFILMAAGIQRFAQSKNMSLEVKVD